MTHKMKGLENVIIMDVLGSYKKDKEGWRFIPELPNCTHDTFNAFQ